jgi:hypothetical protein
MAIKLPAAVLLTTSVKNLPRIFTGMHISTVAQAKRGCAERCDDEEKGAEQGLLRRSLAVFNP